MIALILPITLTYTHPYWMEDAEMTHEQIFRGYISYDDLNAAILRWVTDIQDTYIKGQSLEDCNCSEQKT